MVVFGQGDVPKRRVEFLKNTSMKVVYIAHGQLFRGLHPKSIGLGAVWVVERNLMERKIKNRVKLNINIHCRGRKFNKLVSDTKYADN